MSDNLFNKLQKLYESNYTDFNEEDLDDLGDDEPIVLDPEYATTAPDDVENPSDKSKEQNELPDPKHPDLFAQPDIDRGIIYINDKAIPNDYGKGHIVCVYKKDTADKKVRTNKLKLGHVKVPFSIINTNANGEEFVTKDDIKKNFNSPNFVIKLLTMQPITLDRNVAASNKYGNPGEDARRKQIINPNVQEPSGEMKTGVDDALGRKIRRNRDKPEFSAAQTTATHGRDVESGLTDKQRGKLLTALTPDEYKQSIQWAKKTGSRDIRDFYKSIGKEIPQV